MSVTVIYAGQKHRHSIIIKLKWVWFLLVLFAFITAIVGHRLYDGYSATLMQYKIASITGNLSKKNEQLTRLKEQSDQQLIMLATKVGELQAQVSRLNALGGRLAEQAELEDGEFDFSQPMPMGGPISDNDLVLNVDLKTLTQQIEEVSFEIKNNEEQMQLLESVLMNHHISNDSFIFGMPVKGKAYVTSLFGVRSDPFTGRARYHKGVDIAGRHGMPITATAAGIVSWAGAKTGYGKLVEINHGDGFITRYAHAKAINVVEGDVVSRGQVIALMGSTGRSTGPHVHYEVLKDGIQVNPRKYIYRKAS